MSRPHGAYFLLSAAVHAAVFATLAGPGGEPPPRPPPPLQVRLALAPREAVSAQSISAMPAPQPASAPARPWQRVAMPAPSPQTVPVPTEPSPTPAPPTAAPPAGGPAPLTEAPPPQNDGLHEQIALARPQVPVAVTETSRYPDPELVAGYTRTLSSDIARLKRYPALARMRGWQGKTVVSITIGPRGEVLDLKVAESSGFDVLDRQALEMVREAQPLPAAPPSLRGLALVVQLPVVFSLVAN